MCEQMQVNYKCNWMFTIIVLNSIYSMSLSN